MLTKKHFIKLATIVGELRYKLDLMEDLVKQTWEIEDRIYTLCEEENPLFNADKFADHAEETAKDFMIEKEIKQ